FYYTNCKRLCYLDVKTQSINDGTKHYRYGKNTLKFRKSQKSGEENKWTAFLSVNYGVASNIVNVSISS
ncbi:hypothetical protein OFN32_38275, partial [Escherichia coli]|nr:hypothetical protein [Escherichia coli]